MWAAEEETGTHLDTEAGSVGGTVHCSTEFHGALDGPRCIQAAPVIQGQAVLGGRRWRWREGRERRGYEALLTASIILSALLEKEEKSEEGVKAKVAGWLTSTVSFTESITRPHRDHFPMSLSLKVIQAWILYFPTYGCVNACMYPHIPHLLNIHCSHIYY